MANPDLSTITTSFVQFGGQVFGKNVLAWNIRNQGIEVRTNVKAPQVLPRFSTTGTPRPYRAQDDTSGNTVKATDRVLTAYQSKWDMDFDPEEFRNTYLANNDDRPYYQQALDQVSREYLDYIIRTTLWAGARNASGTTPADICDGFGTIIADEITATNLTPDATVGAITSSNAVAAVEAVSGGVADWMREYGFTVYCSYAVFDLYKQDYRTSNQYQFKPRDTGQYMIDGMNAELKPVPWIPSSSQRLVATIPGNLVFGTDLEQIQVPSSLRRNIIEMRPMFPVGCQIKDLDALYVNDQA